MSNLEVQDTELDDFVVEIRGVGSDKNVHNNPFYVVKNVFMGIDSQTHNSA